MKLKASSVLVFLIVSLEHVLCLVVFGWSCFQVVNNDYDKALAIFPCECIGTLINAFTLHACGAHGLLVILHFWTCRD